MKRFKAADGSAIYLTAIGVNLVLQLVLSIPLVFMQNLPKEIKDTVNLCLMSVLQIGFFLTVFLSVKQKKTKLIYRFKPIKWYNIILSVAAGVCVLFGFILSAQWFGVFLEVIGYHGSSFSLYTVPMFIIGGIVTVIMAPIAEEMVFRGALLSGLIQKFKPIAAAALTGLAFSLMHMNPEQTVYQFFLGFAMAYLVIKAGSIIPGTIMHATSNLIAVIFEILPETESDATASQLMLNSPVMFAVGAAVTAIIAAALIYLIGNIFSKTQAAPPELNPVSEEGAFENTEKEALPLFGAKSYKISLVIGLCVCGIIWLITFALGMSGLSA